MLTIDEIVKLKNKDDIKASIIKELIRRMEGEIRISKQLLNDKKWASTDSEYHRECRLELTEQIEVISEIINFLKQKN